MRCVNSQQTHSRNMLKKTNRWSKSFKIGVPQGSSIALIFFILFIFLLFKILTKEERRTGIKTCGYVDEGFFKAKALNENATKTKIQAMFTKREFWITQNWMVFDQAKFEAIYFFCKRSFSNPEIVLLINGTAGIEERSIKPMAKKLLMYWLGVYFDLHLLFSDHVTKIVDKS